MNEIYLRPGVRDCFRIREINDEGTDFNSLGERLFNSYEIDKIIIDSNLIMLKKESGDGQVQYLSLNDINRDQPLIIKE